MPTDHNLEQPVGTIFVSVCGLVHHEERHGAAQGDKKAYDIYNLLVDVMGAPGVVQIACRTEREMKQYDDGVVATVQASVVGDSKSRGAYRFNLRME